jgi:hypothetical protein
MPSTLKYLTVRNPNNPLVHLFTPLFQEHKQNRIFSPITIQDLELRDRLAYNRPSQLHSDIALGKEEPVLKVTLNECISEVAFNRKGQNMRVRFMEKIEKIVDTIYPLKETDEKNRIKLKGYLKACVEFGNAMKNGDPEFPQLQSVAKFMYSHGLPSHSLNFDPDYTKTLLIMKHDEARYLRHLNLLDKISSELEKAFLTIRQNEFKKIFLAMRHQSISILDSPNENFQQALPTIAFPFKNFLAHSFEPNCKIIPFYDFRSDTELIVLKTIRPIGIGEPLTINYENKSKVIRQLRLLHSARIHSKGQCLRLGRHRIRLFQFRGSHHPGFGPKGQNPPDRRPRHQHRQRQSVRRPHSPEHPGIPPSKVNR